MKLFFRQEDASRLETLLSSLFSKDTASGTNIELCEFSDRDMLREPPSVSRNTLSENTPADRLQDTACKDLHLFFGRDGLFLQKNELSMQGDFSSLLPRVRQDRLGSEALVRACRIRGVSGPLRLLDATAGMGEDSFLLAAAGFEVTLYEADPAIALLLADSLRRARELPETSAAAGRMHLVFGDSIAAMQRLTGPPDVILLDPMFPRRKKSGLIKKKFQLLQQLEKPCNNEEELLSAALLAGPKRIVIKRPAKGPALAGIKPDFTLEGKTIRYDCLTPGPGSGAPDLPGF